MQEENKKNNIKTLSFGCRLNALESERIKNMLKQRMDTAIVVNTCAVTAEAERQSGQAVRRIARENKNVNIFVTGCAATRNPELFEKIPGTTVIHNKNKMNMDYYTTDINNIDAPQIDKFQNTDTELSKKFIQIQNGCNHNCTYCITRALRGKSVSFKYQDILHDVQDATKNGFREIVLTGVDIASYIYQQDDKIMLLSDLCKQLLADEPNIQRLRLSSVDPAVPDIGNIINLILSEPRMMNHMHFSMQSGSDTILKSMGRRHNAQRVCNLVDMSKDKITFSWDIICGFPGETDELFNETLMLVQETRPIKIHAFPYSPRPDTPAAYMQNQIDKSISKKRVKIISDMANQNRIQFMNTQIGNTVQVLVEENNIARTPNDIPVKICGSCIPVRTICDVTLTDIADDIFVGKIL